LKHTFPGVFFVSFLCRHKEMKRGVFVSYRHAYRICSGWLKFTKPEETEKRTNYTRCRYNF
jgi:hypothetical protein